MRSSVVILASVSLAAAQSLAGLGDLSSQCQASAGSLITSGFGSCVSILSLANVLSAQGSIVQPLNTWLGSACANTCDQTTLTNATNIVEQGCSSDLQNGNAVASALDVLTKNYTQVKDALCLQAKSNSTFCVTNLLTDIQNASGNNISVSALEGLLTNPSSISSLIQNVNASTVCTDCTHALVSKAAPLANATSSSATSTLSSDVSSFCGSSFLDGQVPSTVQEASSSSSTSGGGSVTSTGLKNSGSSNHVLPLAATLTFGVIAAIAAFVI